MHFGVVSRLCYLGGLQNIQNGVEKRLYVSETYVFALNHDYNGKLIDHYSISNAGTKAFKCSLIPA